MGVERVVIREFDAWIACSDAPVGFRVFKLCQCRVFFNRRVLCLIYFRQYWKLMRPSFSSCWWRRSWPSTMFKPTTPGIQTGKRVCQVYLVVIASSNSKVFISFFAIDHQPQLAFRLCYAKSVSSPCASSPFLQFSGIRSLASSYSPSAERTQWVVNFDLSFFYDANV